MRGVYSCFLKVIFKPIQNIWTVQKRGTGPSSFSFPAACTNQNHAPPPLSPPLQFWDCRRSKPGLCKWAARQLDQGEWSRCGFQSPPAAGRSSVYQICHFSLLPVSAVRFFLWHMSSVLHYSSLPYICSEHFWFQETFSGLRVGAHSLSCSRVEAALWCLVSKH